MSMAALRWARSVRGITGRQKFVLALLADDADAEGVAAVSVPALAEDACLSVRGVQGVLGALAEAGLLLVQPGGGRGITNRYVLAIDTSETLQFATLETPQTATETPQIAAQTPQIRAQTPQISTETPQAAPPPPPPPLVPPLPLASPSPPYNPPQPPRELARAKPKSLPVLAFDVPTPSWLPRDAWLAWCNHRTRLKRSGWTEAAAVRCIAALERFRDQGDDPREVIDQAIAGGWTGLYALKRSGGSSRAPTALSQWADLLNPDNRADLDGHAEEVFP
jgi:hypothetical protein